MRSTLFDAMIRSTLFDAMIRLYVLLVINSLFGYSTEESESNANFMHFEGF